MEDEKIKQIVILSIFSFSTIITILTLFVSIRFYSFVFYVLISEILFGGSRFLCLIRQFYDTYLTDHIVNYLQLGFSLFCNSWTLISVLFHTIIIYNRVIHNRADQPYTLFFQLFHIVFSIIFTLIFMIVKTVFQSQFDQEENVCTSVY